MCKSAMVRGYRALVLQVLNVFLRDQNINRQIKTETASSGPISLCAVLGYRREDNMSNDLVLKESELRQVMGIVPGAQEYAPYT